MSKRIQDTFDLHEPTKNPVGKVKRRHFLLGLAAIGFTASIPGVISCSETPEYDIHNQLNPQQFQLLKAVQNHLFPKSKFGPGAFEFHAAEYFTWVMTDPLKDPNDISRMREGLIWVSELAQELFQNSFVRLTTIQKEKVLRELEQKGKGENWLSLTITYIFEALLSDPIYGSNNRELGWKWISHQPGVPRPTNDNKYQPNV